VIVDVLGNRNRTVWPRRHDEAVLQPRLPLAPDEPTPTTPTAASQPLRVAALFAGIGGIELGLHRAGHVTSFLCENDPAAMAVLRAQFPNAALSADIRELDELPSAEVLTAGFPCQDLSISGRAAGIEGERSGLVAHVFRLLEGAETPPRWLLFENVPFLLRLHRGRGMQWLTRRLSDLGFTWAYRLVDSRAFGLPQRRERVLLLASQTEDPRGVLFGEDAGESPKRLARRRPACGFYWTEGHRGLGWSANCLPPIKVGSGLGIPSPPAIWMPDGSIVTPDIRDLERLQGFPPDYTQTASSVDRRARWRLLGNAVSVPISEWIGGRLLSHQPYSAAHDWPTEETSPWPSAAWGKDGRRFEVTTSTWPVRRHLVPLTEFLTHPGKPLSERAATGLLKRLRAFGARVPADFVRDLEILAGPSHTQAA
jgi:DNA (cytosine-5)-methyltransferase 1